MLYVNRNVSKVAVIATILSLSITEANALDCDTIRDDEMTCLACNIYHEARNQPVKGQVAVAQVTKNRLSSEKFPDTLCKVVWQSKQFSWTKDGRTDKVYEPKSWELAYRIATAVTETKLNLDMTDGAMFYHTKAVDPYWNRKMKITVIFEDHIFYK